MKKYLLTIGQGSTDNWVPPEYLKYAFTDFVNVLKRFCQYLKSFGQCVKIFFQCPKKHLMAIVTAFLSCTATSRPSKIIIILTTGQFFKG